MKNFVVIYKSKYGTTKQYAQWIAEELNSPIFEASEIKPSQLWNYDVVIYGGGLYAGGIIGSKLVAENPCKTLVVFTVGAADPDDTDYSEILVKNFSQELLTEIKVFHLRGGIDYTKLSLVHKGMMVMLKKMVEKTSKKSRAEISDEDKVFLETYGGKADFTSRSTTKPLVDYIRAL
jgi:menaquinone-dependent protoporphyrinogen IX oxidase